MTHPDQIEFYTCPICGAGTGNNVDGVVEHECPLEAEYVKSFTTPTLEEMKEKIIRILLKQKYITDQGIDYNGEKDVALNEILALIATAKREALREASEIVEDECVWYNANNQIPDTELGKEEEHWQMLRKIVKDSLGEVNGRIQEAITQQ